MTHFMEDHYAKIVKESGFKPDYAVDRDNAENEAAFAILRPNNSVKNFRQYVHPQKKRPPTMSRTETQATSVTPRDSPEPQTRRRLFQNKSVNASSFFNKRSATKT
jgi:hypothetical protein